MTWAANELLLRLHIYHDIPPLIVIEEFRDEMNEKYALMNRNAEMIFLTAAETAQMFIDFIIKGD